MLLVSRRIGQRIVLGGLGGAQAEIVLVSTSRKGARLAIVAPKGVTVIRGEVFDSVKSANETMCLAGTRFGTLELTAKKPIEIQGGMLGFPNATSYVLLEGSSSGFGWLQSLDVPQLAFPVIDQGHVESDKPLPSTEECCANAVSPAHTDQAVFFVVAPAGPEGGLVANVLAPVVIDMTSRKGSQVVLDHRRYSAAEPLRSAAPST